MYKWRVFSSSPPPCLLLTVYDIYDSVLQTFCKNCRKKACWLQATLICFISMTATISSVWLQQLMNDLALVWKASSHIMKSVLFLTWSMSNLHELAFLMWILHLLLLYPTVLIDPFYLIFHISFYLIFHINFTF